MTIIPPLKAEVKSGKSARDTKPTNHQGVRVSLGAAALVPATANPSADTLGGNYSTRKFAAIKISPLSMTL